MKMAFYFNISSIFLPSFFQKFNENLTSLGFVLA